MKNWLWRSGPIVLLLLAACYDARRDNPLDPTLTPPVEGVSAVLDDTAGAVLVSWLPYAGDQDFAQYRVLRKIQGREAVDTLAVLTQMDQTSYRDAGLEPEREYLYRVAVVNQDGFAALSREVGVGAFRVPGIGLLALEADSLQGRVDVRWTRYRGPNFGHYQIRRQLFGGADVILATVSGVGDTVWSDTTARPGVSYLYWVRLEAAGQMLDTRQLGVVYDLPPLRLEEVAASSQTAAALVRWRSYRGPRFAGYQIWRQTAGSTEEVVGESAELGDTLFVDEGLDGNTDYGYRVVARTSWEGVAVSSQVVEGRFYGLVDEYALPLVQEAEMRAVGLALDEDDRLHVAATVSLTTTARSMVSGVHFQLDGDQDYRVRFQGHVPARLSPLHLVAGGGGVAVAVYTTADRVLVGQLTVDGAIAWEQLVDTAGEHPASLYLQDDGQVVLVDRQGFLYAFAADGTPSATNDRLNVTLATDDALPLGHLVVGKEAGLGGKDQFFLLAPDRDANHIVGRTPTELGGRLIFGGRNTLFADGVGAQDGQTLNPLALAFDPSRWRLLVLEALGRLQVLDARPGEVAQSYITKWGRFGSGPGEFEVSPPTAVSMVVDSRGWVYVADGQGETGRIQVFAP
ncbi:MAG: hypothetical protein GKR89_26425 [Candidatus Latescibacteria bacterium]|nr:hypothetical protein [Candidatus Latescibacterota bacterium]